MQDADVIALIYSELLKVVGGASVVLAALSAFVGRVWLERIARRENLAREKELLEIRAQIDRQAAELKSARDAATQRTVLVDKVQFEHEYAIYKSAWTELCWLRQVTVQLRSVVQQEPLSELSEDDHQAKLKQFKKPFDALKLTVETNRPFYPLQVHEALQAVVSACARELALAHIPASDKEDFWREAGKSHKAINDTIDAACEAIRTRIAEVRVG